MFTLYVIYHIGITQRPHDHLVQKSRHLDATWVHKLVSKQKSTNLIFFLYDCNEIHYQIGYMGQFVYIICNSSYWYHTEASWSFSSNVKASGHKLVSKQKSTNLIFFLYDCNQIRNQICYMGQFVHIICNSSYWCHTEVSRPFSSKVKASGCNLGA